jgi:hypothetical protein
MSALPQDSEEQNSAGESTGKKPRGPKKPRSELSIMGSMAKMLEQIPSPEGKRRALAYLSNAADEQLRNFHLKQEEDIIAKRIATTAQAVRAGSPSNGNPIF